MVWVALALILIVRGGGSPVARCLANPAQKMIAREETLRDLMRRAQAGDKQAYAVLLEQTGRWLARVSLRRRLPPTRWTTWCRIR